MLCLSFLTFTVYSPVKYKMNTATEQLRGMSEKQRGQFQGGESFFAQVGSEPRVQQKKKGRSYNPEKAHSWFDKRLKKKLELSPLRTRSAPDLTRVCAALVKRGSSWFIIEVQKPLGGAVGLFTLVCFRPLLR